MTEETDWTVYIVQTESGKLYTGITLDLERRLEEHRRGPRGAKFFRTSGPKRVVFEERHPERPQALRREHEIKAMTRSQKLALIGARSRE